MLFKQASFFSIDHPLDPKRKVLNHAAVEAPAHKTFYDGVAQLDAKGQARVALPAWFAALNDEKSLCYQLTPVGSAAPDLHVASPFHRGTFVIAGGRAKQRVCWQVTGVRKDAFARANPVVVEQKRSEARPAGEGPSRKQIEEMGKSLRDANTSAKHRAERTKAVLAGRKFPGFQAADRLGKPEGGFRAMITAATQLLKTFERLKRAAR
jgi:hypothetical protein